MTILELEQPAQPSASVDEPDFTHQVCCVDDDLTLCGRDAADMPWTPVPQEVNCVVCADLVERAMELAGSEPFPAAPADSPCRLCPARNREGKP